MKRMGSSSEKHKEEDDDHIFLSEDETREKHLKSGPSSRKRHRKADVLDSPDNDYYYQARKRLNKRVVYIHSKGKCSKKKNEKKKDVLPEDSESSTDDSDRPKTKAARYTDKKKLVKTKQHNTTNIWDSSDFSSSDDDADQPFFVQRHDRFANVEVRKDVCYYPSSLQTIVTEISRLNLTDRHLDTIMRTPFWFLVRSIVESSMGMSFMQSINKYEDDIRLLVRKFDYSNKGFRMGLSKRLIKLEKQDLVSIFGVRDGSVEINVQKGFQTTPWMRRCFPEMLVGKSAEAVRQLKRAYIYRKLRRLCHKDDKIHAQDIARLMHCYLLASLFMPSSQKTIVLGLCVFLEKFSDICKFDWSSLVVNQLVNQMAKTRTMKIGGCAMLLPYWLCEHTGFIQPKSNGLFPRYLRWDLNQLHEKISEVGLDVTREDLSIQTVLRPTSREERAFKELIKETQEADYGVDTSTPTPNGTKENVKRTAAKEATTKPATPGIIESVPDTDQTNQKLLKDENQELKERVKQLSGDKDTLLKTMTRKIGDLKAEKSRELDEVRAKLNEKEKLLIQVQSDRETLGSSLTTQKEINAKQEQDLTKVREDLLKKTTETQLLTQRESEINRLQLVISKLKKFNVKQEQDLTKAGEILLKRTNENELLTQRESQRIHELELVISNLKKINTKQERDLTKAGEDLLKRTTENELLTQRESRRVNELESEISNLKKINAKHVQDFTKVRENMSKRTTENELFTQRERERVHKLESEISHMKKVNAEQEQDLTKVREDLSKRTTENALLTQREGQRVRKLESEILKLKTINAKHEQDLTKLREDLLKRTAENELLTQRETERVHKLETEISNLKKINAKHEQDLTKTREDLLKRTTENEFLTRRGSKRVCELESVISTLKENLKSAQTKERDQIKVIKALENDLGVVNLCWLKLKECERVTKENFDSEKARYKEKIANLGIELEEKNKTLREKVNRLSEEEQMTTELESMVAEMVNATHDGMKYFELVSDKDSKLMKAAKTRANDAVEEVELNYRSRDDGAAYYESTNMTDKRNSEIGTSGAQCRKGKLKVTQNLCSPGPVARALNSSAREDTSKPKYVTPACKDSLPVSKKTDPVMEFLRKSLESPKGNCVIWSGEGPFSKVTAEDALKVLLNQSLTSVIIDSWGELLIQYLSKEGKMTSSFIFTSRIMEVLDRDGESSIIQEIVDSQIRRAVKSHILILPVFIRGSGGNYWTLLMYTVSSTWNLFNSVQPRSIGTVDTYNRCFSLMKYMEARIRPALIDLKQDTPLTRAEETRTSFPSLQIEGPLDCGVLVCHIMEKILESHSTSTTTNITEDGVYRTSTAANYRRRMVESFCFPDNIKDLK